MTDKESQVIPRVFECTLMSRPYGGAKREPCQIGGQEFSSTIMARSPGAARYEYLRRLRECCWTVQDGDNYVDVGFQHIRVRRVDSISMAMLAAFAYTAQSRGVPLARIGTRVEVGGKGGVLVDRTDSANFRVMFDDGTEGCCHPNWEIVYFDKAGTVLYDFRGSSLAPVSASASQEDSDE